VTKVPLAAHRAIKAPEAWERPNKADYSGAA
jgi:hypothetical protein